MNLYGLIGYPLEQSFSAQYFKEKFIRENLINCEFKNFAIQNINEFPALLKENPLLKGLSVTIPYKQKVLQFITSLSDEVKQTGATNSIKISDNKLVAYNTDIIGFEKSFVKKLRSNQNKALVLGTGGASKAVQFVLKKLGIEFLVVSRASGLFPGSITYQDITKEIMEQYSVIINCTPAGMYPDENVCPDLLYEIISSHHYVFDLIYKPAKTLLLRYAEQKGALTQNGFDMLILQAEESWKIWNS